MPCTSRFNEEINIIETVYSGTLTLNELNQHVREIMELAQKHQVTRFLADCTGIMQGGSSLDIYDLAKMIEDVPEVHRMKEAILLPVQPDSAGDMKFFETTAKNRGLNVQVFANRENAIQWLCQ